MMTSAEVLAFLIGGVIVELLRAFYLFWSSRPDVPKWPKNYRVICSDCSMTGDESE